MPLLHFPTLLVVTATHLVLLAVALFLVMGHKPGRAARLVQASIGLQAAAWVALIGSSYAWDQALSTFFMLSNALAQWALFEALALWLGPRPGRRWVQLLVVAIPLGYTLGFGHYAFRVGWSNLLTAALLALVAQATLYPAMPASRRWRWLLCGSLLAMAMLTAARGALGAFTADYPSFRSPHPINLAAALATSTAMLLGIVALLVAWRAESEQRLRRLARTDPLTDLLNRRGFEVHGQALMSHARRYRMQLSALMLDLDYFKQINDERGHEAGDRALALFARVLTDSSRSGDVVARLGGEEFGALLMHEGGSGQAALALDRRLRARLHAASRAELGYVLDYSAGVARLAPEDADLAALMARADAALYEAKAQGRGRVTTAA